MYGVISPRASIFIIAGFLSLVLSIWLGVTNDVINTDAICYLESAQVVPRGLQAVMTACAQAKWPFYSILIYTMATFFHVSLEVSAYGLNACFTLITVLVFMGLVDAINSSNKNRTAILWLAAFVILFSHECNVVKHYIVRDHGFWAFYLLSLWFLLRFVSYRKWIAAYGFSISLVIATLFRIEGAVFLGLIPFGVFFLKERTFYSRCYDYVRLNTGLLFLVIAIVWLYFFYSGSSLPSLGRLDELIFQVQHGSAVILQNFHAMSYLFAHHVLRYSAKHDAEVMVFLLWVVGYIWTLTSTVSFIYLVLILYAWIKKIPKISTSVWMPLLAYMIVNIMITAVFLMQNMFLSKRYLLALSLICMLWVPFALFELLQQWSYRKWPLCVAASWIIMAAFFSIMHIGPSKKYIHEAGNWLAFHVPHKKSIYTNDYQLMYYSKHFGPELVNQIRSYTKIFQHGQLADLKKFDYLALRVDKKYLQHNAELLQSITWQPIIIFNNPRGDEVRIYQVIH